MSDASFEVGYPRRRWTETHLEIGHHDDAPAGVRVPALASPAHRVDGGRAPALVSQTLGRRSGMPWPIFGARARRTQTPLPSGATPLAI
jgi:hypothetical protein